jgi:prolyl 4-hydroxylase
VKSSPSVVRFSNLLTATECRYLIDRAMPLLKPSSVVDPRSGKLVRNPIRTSDAAAFPLIDESPAIHALNRRFAAVSRTDPRQGEPLQILRYQGGQEYRPHIDALAPGGNQRRWTLLAYLNEGYDGGETDFPTIGLSIRGKTGDALLFANALDNGLPDERTVHAGLPVKTGAKFVASRWIRAHPLDLSGRGTA